MQALHYELMQPCVAVAICPICAAAVLAVRDGTTVGLGEKCPHVVTFFGLPEMKVGFAGDGE